MGISSNTLFRVVGTIDKGPWWNFDEQGPTLTELEEVDKVF